MNRIQKQSGNVMSRKTKHKIKAPQPSDARRTGWWVAGIIVVAVIIAVSGYWMWGKYAASSGPDTSKLIGSGSGPTGDMSLH